MITCFRAKMFPACALALSLLIARPIRGGNVLLGWTPNTYANTAGYNVYYGLSTGNYTWSLNAGDNTVATISGLAPGVVYYFATTAYASNGVESLYSLEITNRLPLPPAITNQPSGQTLALGNAAALTVGALGDSPLRYQWCKAGSPIAGATSSVLKWSQIGNANAGNYTVVVSNTWGCVTSAVAALAVLDPAAITTQPLSQTVIATMSASLSCGVTGTAPLFLQWYQGGAAIAGATNSTLAWSSVAALNAGSYYMRVSNAVCVATSAVVTLTVLPSTTIATAAGAYNGLFFQTNANGTPLITLASAGFLGNCVVSSNGVFSGTLNVRGLAYPLAGTFTVGGNATVSISPPGSGSPAMKAALQLDLINGTRRMTGTISSLVATNTWTASLIADRATNAFPNLTQAAITILPGLSLNSPLTAGVAASVVSGGVNLLVGVLGDGAVFSQSVPISKDGNCPIYVKLYNSTGLLEGWINLAGGVVTGSLTWIRPAGVSTPLGFPLGFDTVVQVTGTTTSH